MLNKTLEISKNSLKHLGIKLIKLNSNTQLRSLDPLSPELALAKHVVSSRHTSNSSTLINHLYRTRISGLQATQEVCKASDLGGTRHVAGLLPVRTEVNQHLLIQIIMQKWF